ncbi:MAG: hypothetical protein WC848_00610 [Parcubacteria group bacterium]|jgi:hypothetical protein
MAEKELLYKYLIVICREGITEVIPFENEITPESVDAYFERVSEQWSDAYFCKVLKGPIKI